jgi:hypothetical protein
VCIYVCTYDRTHIRMHAPRSTVSPSNHHHADLISEFCNCGGPFVSDMTCNDCVAFMWPFACSHRWDSLSYSGDRIKTRRTRRDIEKLNSRIQSFRWRPRPMRLLWALLISLFQLSSYLKQTNKKTSSCR